MTIQTIERLCLKIPHAVKEYKPSWDSTLFRIGSESGKIFVLIMHDDELPRMNFKNDPFVNIQLRQDYADITAAYHMNKKHWNTFYYKHSALDVKIVEQLIRESYEAVLEGLCKKERQLYQL